MSDYKDENGEWRHGTSGERLNVHDYQGGPANYNSGGGGIGIFGGDKIIKGAGGILKLIPYIIAFVLYFIFDLLETSKGKKGRLGQSIVFGIFVGVLATIAFGSLFLLLPVSPDSASPEKALMRIVKISQTFSYIVIALVAIWFYRSHYWAVRCMRMNFLFLLINPLTIFVNGSILFFIINFVLTVNGTLDDSNNANFMIFAIPFIIAVIVYLISAKPFVEQAKDLQRRNMPFPNWEPRKKPRKNRKKREKQENAREQDKADYNERKQEEKAVKAREKEQQEKDAQEIEQWKNDNQEQIGDYDVLNAQATLFEKKKDYTNAIRVYKDMLIKCPNWTSSINNNLATAYFNNSMYDEAIKVCDELLENKDRLYGSQAINIQKLRDKAAKKKG